ncbi:MAG TPA: DNA translocase FtsK 4TM domain-containing protein [Candidatus Saccharimonadales bacterium]|nr:DNA translocase FtsK 4TM domain-containing protein [Candidatus Saccharimonadales bacterium]
MSKKKNHKKKKNEKDSGESAFWPLSGAIFLLVLAFLLLLGGLGTGGTLPTELFDGAYWAFGWAAYLTPLALGYLGVLKFRSEDRQIPLDKFIGMGATVIFSSSWLYVLFASKDDIGNFAGGHGGKVGQVVSTLVLNALDRWPTGLLFLIFAVLALFYTFGISPRVLLKLFRPLKSDDDTDLEDLKTRDFKLNEGVPVERHGVSRFSSLRESAHRVAPAEDQTALTVASDPDWKFPGLDLLIQKQDKADAGDIEGNAKTIKQTFENFSLDVDMEGANVGPRVTQYTLKPPSGVKLTKITALENNLALDLAAHSIRIEAPIPGKKLVGIEVPNVKPATVRISSMLMAQEWQTAKSPLSIAIGKDISGKAIIGDLDQMPHLLIAGQTGSGKSVMINSVLTSLLYRNSPSDLKLILVDPKRVELKPYDGIPHLLTPVITEPEKCISALKWVVAEMERRYKALSEVHRRNINEYNAVKKEEGMPYIVIVIDELSDLMMMAARDVEALVVRIAQKSRAVGIHLVLATQRPSVNVITGLIKANIPARVAFTTASQVDSRTIIDQMGAEKLLNQGDMLLLTAEMPKPKRVQGALISDAETHKVADFIRNQREPQYNEEIITQPVNLSGRGNVLSDVESNDEPIFQDAVRVVVEARKASTSLLQRRLRIGYGKAARLVESMEEQGIVGPADGSRPREVLVNSVDEVFGRSEGANKTPEEGDVYDDMPDEPEQA